MKLFKQVGVVLMAALPMTTFADGDVELAETMGQLQYFSHKAALAIDSKNKDLAGFYAHELEEYIEEAAEIESYDGHPVGKLIKSMLIPTFEDFEAALKSGDWNKTSAQFDSVLRSCNACHDATEHGFIKIERRSDNPYMQSFKAPKKSQDNSKK